MASAIGGPASGWKGCEIVSADSRQVYRGLDIGTGKDLNEYGDIKYYLIDICEPEEKFTMFDWLERARVVIEDIFNRGKLPIIVGGTGLYVQALVEGFHLSQISNLKSQICNSKLKTDECHPELVSGSNPDNSGSRNKFGMTEYKREELDKMTLPELQRLAKKVDPAGFKKIDRINPIRLIRLIERFQSGELMTKIKPDFEVLQIGIELPREELYNKIDQRADEWFRDGIMEEVESLLSCGVDPEWLIKLGLEYRIITSYLLQTSKIKSQTYNFKLKNFGCHTERSEGSQQINNKTIKRYKNNGKDSSLNAQNDNFEIMKQDLKYKIHAYARRQLTWFRRFSEIKWVKSKEEALEIVEEFMV